jgi:hypothetical protein
LANKEKRFVQSVDGDVIIVVDTQTGVNYLCLPNRDVSQLYNAEGTLVITKENDK